VISFSAESMAAEFLEIASEQRLNIIMKLKEKKSNISNMAKELQATAPEVHRNFSRLLKAGLIEKVDGNYHLTLYGKTIFTHFPSLTFMLQNKEFFKTHDFGDIPTKFIHRIGALGNSKIINGFVKVLGQWKNIYENADEYILNILIEVPYSGDIIDPLVKKLNNEVKVKTIFSDTPVFTEERDEIHAKVNFKKFINNDLLQRKMKKDVKVMVIFNEKEAGIIFPLTNSGVDMSKMLYSSDELFHEWCLDYFEDSWKIASAFQENKLKKVK